MVSAIPPSELGTSAPLSRLHFTTEANDPVGKRPEISQYKKKQEVLLMQTILIYNYHLL